MLDICAKMLKGKFWRVDANDLQAKRAVLLVPTSQTGQRPLRIDAGIRPEVHEADLSA
jgi:hypothetical protein